MSRSTSRRTSQYRHHLLSRRPTTRPASGRVVKKRRVGPEQPARDAHPVVVNKNTLTDGCGALKSIRDKEVSCDTEEVDGEAEARDTSTLNSPPNLNSTPNQDLKPQSPRTRNREDPRDANSLACDEANQHGQTVESELPISDAQAVVQPKGKEQDPAAGSRINGGDKEMSYTRNLLRKLMEVISEVDAHKKAAEAQSNTQGEDQAETEAIYSMIEMRILERDIYLEHARQGHT
ncbi:unnamed protein product [Clonostachys rosea]|uniref:Uncharacterized protein n=1 Tax=Bionectria ochroleuca TaxID=29856 RepID=A0ABY6U0H8_BIOOC|nr:unnamed protein product [Clonostachys rosea]